MYTPYWNGFRETNRVFFCRLSIVGKTWMHDYTFEMMKEWTANGELALKKAIRFFQPGMCRQLVFKIGMELPLWPILKKV